MVFLVPFDGSPIARAALDRAVEYGNALDRDVVAASYVPTGTNYAERRRWVDPSEDFAAETVASDLRRKIAEATDEAELQYADFSAQSPEGELSEEVRKTAREVDATVVVAGCGEGGRVVVPVDEDADDFDVHVVRRT